MELGLSVQSVAADMNFSVDHYRMLETGVRKQTLTSVVAFSELYHVSTDYLIYGYSNSPELQSALETVITMLSDIKGYV